jgi:hypothetical protein
MRWPPKNRQREQQSKIQEVFMGLDMYAYVASRAGQQDEFYSQDIKFNNETGDWDVPEGGASKPREIAYWRKHSSLHGWMRKLWQEKGFDGSFNGDELELTWEDLDRLEQTIRAGNLPPTRGFFFGDPADDYYRDQDLDFVKRARAELFVGLKVFYNSSW